MHAHHVPVHLSCVIIRRRTQREREELATANAIATDMLIAQLGADEDDSVTLVSMWRRVHVHLTQCRASSYSVST
jgi:hypothetical protein